MKSLIALIAGALLVNAAGCAHAGRVVLLDDDFSDSSKVFYSALKDGIAKSGYDLQEVDGAHLTSALAGDRGPGTILVLPNAVSFPADAKSALMSFLKNGNHMVAISGPAFSRMLVNVDGKWMSRDDAKTQLANAPGKQVMNFSAQQVGNWMRASGSPGNPAAYDFEMPASASAPSVLHAKISKLQDWDTLGSPALSDPFGSGNTVTTFMAKGGPNTPELLIEWKEKDGARWMGVVKFTTEWKRYALTPDDFRFWPDGSPAGRGGAGDRFKPENASVFTVGLSNGITAQQLGVPHEYWIADVRAVKDEYNSVDYSAPIFESISPQYKTYPVAASEIRITSAKDAILKDLNATRAGFADRVHAADAILKDVNATASIQRPFGLGSDGVRKCRQIPLLTAYDSKGEKRGIAGHLFLNTLGDYTGSIWGYVGIDQGSLAKNPAQIVPVIVSMIGRIRDGVFLSNAGSEFFAYSLGENMKFGAFISNMSESNVDADVRMVIESKGKPFGVVNAKTAVPARTGSKPVGVVLDAWALPEGLYTATTTLMIAGKQVDELSHEFQVIKYAKLTKKNTVTLDGPDFALNGKKWYPLGMNYWPRYSVGQEPGDYWLHWLSPEQYDPAMIEADLTQANQLKMNLFSIQYGKIDQSRPLMDFLARAERHGIKVHVFMPGVHPLGLDPKIANPMIRAAHIAQSPAFFAYDLGWEVNVGPYSARQSYDKDWQNWVVDHYGSIEAAEKDWRYKSERAKGLLTGPQDKQLLNDGDWRIYVAAYRHFWDDEISKGYMNVRNNIRSIDKMHLMGARSGYGGTGAAWVADKLTFDLLSGAKHIDFISPEAYNIGGDRRGFLVGGFHAAYGRHFSGAKPIYWAEYGSPLFYNIEPSNYRNEYTDEQYERERAYYEGIVRMTIDTFANGSAGWWWPGGLRVDEKSDFGVINPDGTPRPAALAISKLADEFYKPRTVLAPNAFIKIDRDKYVTGYAGIFGDASRQYVDLMDKGKTPGVTTDGTGTTSGDVPLTAVGNVPYNGSNPLKYMNAEFNWLKINGVMVSDDGIVKVEPGKSVTIEASIGNTAEAKWLSPKSAAIGGVYLTASFGGKSKAFAISADVAFLGDAAVRKSVLTKGVSEPTQFVFRMSAKGRADFGEVMRVTLDPR